MTTEPTPAPTPTPVASTPLSTAKTRPLGSLLRSIFLVEGKPGEVIIISHSNLFYWWPVWLLGFVMAGITWFTDTHMAVVPDGTVAVQSRQIDVAGDGKLQKRDVLIAPQDASLPTRLETDGNRVLEQPRIRMVGSKNPGVLFAVVLLLVIVITNVPMRGLWSVLTISVIVLLAVIFAQLGLWDRIFFNFRLLAIHVNMGGYLFLSLVLFIVWLVTFLFFDRQFYVAVTPGQVRVHLEIGGGEIAYDTVGMVFHKRRSDTFRHWILGLGSGDLILRPANSKEHIDLPNVLFVGRRVREIERRLKQKEIVAA